MIPDETTLAAELSIELSRIPRAVRGCTFKRRHNTENAAVEFAARTRGEFGQARAYKCPHCERWHLTSQLQPRSEQP